MPAKARTAWRRWALVALVFVLLGVAAYVVLVRQQGRTPTSPPAPEDSRTPAVDTGGFVPDGIQDTAGDTATVDPSLMRSENYRVGDIAVGGDITISSVDSDQYVPLEIVSVRGEALPGKDKNEARMLVSWKTSKPAMSTVRYGKHSGDTAKSLDEDGFSVDHSMIVSGLDQSSTYVYTIRIRDRWGNELESESYAVHTNAKEISLFELISNALAETFGWAF